MHRFRVKMTLILNHLHLILLTRALKMYRRQSNKLLTAMDSDTLWVSGIQDEERHLDRVQKIIERRIKTSCDARKKKR